MLTNNEFLEEFKKSLSATVKSIGKNDEIEINYVKENPSVIGKTINLTEPNIENICFSCFCGAWRKEEPLQKIVRSSFRSAGAESPFEVLE